MTDYDDAQESIDESSPYELYRFVGTYRNYYMTSDHLPHEYLSDDYLVSPGLKRTSVKAGTQDESNTDLTITMPIAEQLVRDYAFQITPPSLTVEIIRFHRGAATPSIIWKGPIASIVVTTDKSGSWATFRIPSVFGNVLQGNIPNVHIQPPCNHVLYNQRCGVSRVANAVDTTVISSSGTTVVVASLGAFAGDPIAFVGGEILVPARNERRMINAQAGSTMNLNYAFGRLPNGTSIQIVRGCDHSRGPNGCAKFNNLPRFGGFPYVPGESKNPFFAGIG